MFLASIELKLLAGSADLKFDQFKKKLWIHRVNANFLEFRGLLDFENKEKLGIGENFNVVFQSELKTGQDVFGFS